jgi:hypothetical protein
MRIESRATYAFCFGFFVATGLAACGGGGGNTGTAGGNGGTTTSGSTSTTTNGTASCSMCDKAATCCAALLSSPEVGSFLADASLLSGLLGDASLCSSFSTAICNELGGTESVSYATDCQQEIQDGQQLGLSACN